mgnify:CR=1 FL=1
MLNCIEVPFSEAERDNGNDHRAGRWLQLTRMISLHGQQQSLGQKRNVATALAKVFVVGLVECFVDFVGGGGNRPLGTLELVADQQLGALNQIGVAQHHLLGLENLTVLAVVQAALDGL